MIHLFPTFPDRNRFLSVTTSQFWNPSGFETAEEETCKAWGYSVTWYCHRILSGLAACVLRNLHCLLDANYFAARKTAIDCILNNLVMQAHDVNILAVVGKIHRLP
jgi:hypothetical protein